MLGLISDHTPYNIVRQHFLAVNGPGNPQEYSLLAKRAYKRLNRAALILSTRLDDYAQYLHGTGQWHLVPGASLQFNAPQS